MVGLAVGFVGLAVGFGVGTLVGASDEHWQFMPYELHCNLVLPLAMQLLHCPVSHVGGVVGATVGFAVGAVGFAVGAAVGSAPCLQMGHPYGAWYDPPCVMSWYELKCL